jgi:hypothetical protein
MSLNVVDFGTQLVESNDLDPIYVMLWDAHLPLGKLRRWLLSYWCFYHAGTASWIVDQADYWAAMRTAAADKVSPRGTERRHFRGAMAKDSIADLARYGVEAIFDNLCAEFVLHPIPLETFIERATSYVGFGPWIAFKMADMLERLGLCEVDFTNADSYLYTSPVKGAHEVVLKHFSPSQRDLISNGREEVEAAFTYLGKHLKGLTAPPRHERPLNAQEFETILCKYHSHLSGHYNPGHDIEELHRGLLRFARWPTAQLLLRHVPKATIPSPAT